MGRPRGESPQRRPRSRTPAWRCSFRLLEPSALPSSRPAHAGWLNPPAACSAVPLRPPAAANPTLCCVLCWCLANRFSTTSFVCAGPTKRPQVAGLEGMKWRSFHSGSCLSIMPAANPTCPAPGSTGLPVRLEPVLTQVASLEHSVHAYLRSQGGALERLLTEAPPWAPQRPQHPLRARSYGCTIANCLHRYNVSAHILQPGRLE